MLTVYRLGGAATLLLTGWMLFTGWTPGGGDPLDVGGPPSASSSSGGGPRSTFIMFGGK